MASESKRAPLTSEPVATWAPTMRRQQWTTESDTQQLPLIMGTWRLVRNLVHTRFN